MKLTSMWCHKKLLKTIDGKSERIKINQKINEIKKYL